MTEPLSSRSENEPLRKPFERGDGIRERLEAAEGERDRLREEVCVLEKALGYYADDSHYNEDAAPTYLNLSPPADWLGEEYDARTTLDEGKLARQTLADIQDARAALSTGDRQDDDSHVRTAEATQPAQARHETRSEGS